MTAYLLVIHGSRDPNPMNCAQQLAQQLASNFNPTPLIRVGVLEGGINPLWIQIKNLVDEVIHLGYNSLVIYPLFLLPGVHVMSDIPEQIALAQTTIDHNFKIILAPYLGSQAKMIDLLQEVKRSITASSYILLSHGSKRKGSHDIIENIADQITARTAYWSVSPTLSEQITSLVAVGHRSIGIIPYFLFPGPITQAISHQIQDLQPQYPQIKFYLADPIGINDQLVELISFIL